MSFRTDLLTDIDDIRSISGPEDFDIRVNQLVIRTRTWSGTRLSDGIATDVDLVLPARYPIRQITAQEVSSSSGQYEVGDIFVDHITPIYTPAQLNPPVTVNNVEILYIIRSSDADGAGHVGTYRLIDLINYRPFTTQMILRHLGND